MYMYAAINIYIMPQGYRGSFMSFNRHLTVTISKVPNEWF